MTDPVYVFLHNPKTGGTTFNGHCVKHMTLDEDFVHFGPFGKKASAAAGLPAFHKRDDVARSKALVLGGHGTWFGMHELVPNKVPRYFTFLRRPASRLVSKYNGFMTRKKNEGKFRSFDEWYAEEPKDAMTRLYNQFEAGRGVGEGAKYDAEPNLAAASAFLESLWYVGVTERLDDALSFLFGKIGVEGPVERLKVSGEKKSGDLSRMDREIPKLITLTPELEQRIEADNPLDVQLYAKALALMERGPRAETEEAK